MKKNCLEQDWSCEEERSSGTGSCIGSRLRGLFSTLAVVLLVLLEGEYWTGGSCDMVENDSNDNASEERCQEEKIEGAAD